jgi:hypothetical protein
LSTTAFHTRHVTQTNDTQYSGRKDVSVDVVGDDDDDEEERSGVVVTTFVSPYQPPPRCLLLQP